MLIYYVILCYHYPKYEKLVLKISFLEEQYLKKFLQTLYAHQIIKKQLNAKKVTLS